MRRIFSRFMVVGLFGLSTAGLAAAAEIAVEAGEGAAERLTDEPVLYDSRDRRSSRNADAADRDQEDDAA